MTEPLLITIFVIIAALAFDFVNGFHDAANSIATVVVTKVLTPKQAVLWAAFFNVVALFLFGTGVAKTVGSGMIDIHSVTPPLILAGLLGAIAWGLLTWWLALPTSSSHALLGGYAGAAMTNSALRHGWSAFFTPIVMDGWFRTLCFIVIAPVIGFALGHLLMRMVMFAKKKWVHKHITRVFGALQLFSSAFLSLMHGSNDAQKTAGIICSALVAGGVLKEFRIPFEVVCASYAMMGLGTLCGGWRIVDTMGRRLTRLRPDGGFSAETAAATSILFATLLDLPVSTTHATTGAILGVGAAQNPKTVKWRVAERILAAWLITIPAAAAMGAAMASLVYLFNI